MSSRRLMTRSYSGEGRSSNYNGDEGNGTSRPGSRSYLSNVRPENRSTLCSIMAQLTEETQPSFETTLKSKAVSETSNVKFTCVVTGHPTPEITWYKDEMQLDRYCGLPKYEIIRDGQNHSLHIYNCTVDDAAIYQASAANTKGIVSCSGVLEVGVMSEYKIHQRYFAKLKQKAENKRRELEGKENQGPAGRQDQLRTISPDRSQRKRRSPMEASLSTPSSMEDEGTEESHQALVAQGEARLQETAMGDVEEKPVPVTTVAASPITNGQAAKENGNNGPLYVKNSAQKTVTAHQPRTPFAKKKIKISNGTESVKANTLADTVSEERGVSVEAGVAPAPTQSIHSQGPSEEVMEVENTVYPSAVASNHIKATENCQKSAPEKALPVKNMPVAKENARMEGNVAVPSHKEQPVVPKPPVRRSSTLHKEQPVVPIPPVRRSSTLHKEQPAVPIPPVRRSPSLHKEQPVVPKPPVPKSSTQHKEQPAVPIPPVPKSSTLHKEQPVVPIPPVPKSSTQHKEQPVGPIPPVPKSSTLHQEQPVVPIPPVPKSSTLHKEQPVVPVSPVPKSSTLHKEQPVVQIPPVPKSSTLHKEQLVVQIPPVPKSSTQHKEQPVGPIPPVPKSSTLHKEQPVVPIPPVPKSSTLHKEQPVVPIPPVPKSSTLHKEQPIVPIPPVPKSSTLHKEQPVVLIPPVPKSSTLHKEQPVVPIPPVPKSSPLHKEQPVVQISPVPKSSTLHKEQPVVSIPPVPKSSTQHKEQPVVPIPPVPKSSTLHKEQPVGSIPPVPKSSPLHKEQPVVQISPAPKSSTLHKEQPVVQISPVPKSSTQHKEQPVGPIPPVPKSSTLHKEQPVVPIPPVPKSSTLHKEQPVGPIPPVPKSSTLHKEQPVVPIPPVPKSSTLHKEQPVVPIPPVPKSSTLHKEQPVGPIPPVPKSSTLHKEQPVGPISPVRRPSTPLSSRNFTSSETKSKQAAKLEKDRKVRPNEKGENHKSQSPNPPIVSSRQPLKPVVTPLDPSNSTVREDIYMTEQQEDVAVMEVDEKPLAAEPQLQTATPLLGKAIYNMTEDSATVGPQTSNTSTHRAPVCVIGLVSDESPHEREAASPRRPCEPHGHQLSGEETSPSLRNASASQPPQLGEVTQARTQAKRNDAPVRSEPPPTRCEMDVQSPQRPPLGEEAPADDGQTPALHNPDQSASDEMTQGTWDHSKGSNESHAVPFTDLQKSSLDSPGDGENTPGCNVSPAIQRGQVEIAIKTVGTEIQVDKKVEGDEEGRLEVLGDNLACTEKKVVLENRVVPRNRSEQVKIERTTEVIGMTIMDVSHNEMERKVPALKRAKEIPAHPKSPNLKPTKLESVVPVMIKNPDKANFQNTNMSEQQIETFKEIPTPASKVISIAELLRAQLKAIGAVTDKSQTPVDNIPFSTTTKTQHASEKRPQLRMDHKECRLDPEKPQLGREMEARVDASPPSNIEANHLEVQHRPAKPEHKSLQSTNAVIPTITAEHRPIQPLSAGTPTVDALRNHVVIPPISVIDVGSPLETRELSSSSVKDNDSVMDTGQESGASPPVPLKDNTSASPSGTENVQIDLSPIMQEEDLTSATPPRSSPPMISRPENNQPLANTVVEMDSGHSLPTIVNSQHSIVSSVMEHDDEKHVQSEDLVFTPSLTPEMQHISEAHVRSTQTGSTTPLDQNKDGKPTTGGSQTMPRLTTESPLGPETQGTNTPLNQQESSPSTSNEYSNNDSFTPLTDAESSLLLRKGNGAATSIPAATPQELASGARRKIFIPKPKEEDSETTLSVDTQPLREEVAPKKSSKLSPSPATPSMSPNLSRRSPLLQTPSGQRTPPTEKRSPLLSKKKVALETPAPSQEPPQQIDTPKMEEKHAKDKHNPFKAPQVIRKIRGEPFSDALEHLKLWCQFFNVLSDSTVKWYRDEVEIAEVKRSAGDETPVALAIVQASSRDCGVYGCTIANEYGTDSTDLLLSVDILSGMFLREDLEVGEEIEMTPLLFNKGLADPVWGDKFFGRVMIKESHVGEGSSHKAWRAKVIYGLEPVFESGNTCVIKVRNPIAYGGKEESNLVERNLNIAQQECRIQNMAREYCKIFSAEARVIENFGAPLEVIPVYMMYRPANAIPHATVEADLKGVYLKYSLQDTTGRLVMRTGSEVEQKCCALQHWVHQWTNGNLLLTRLEGVDTKITNVGISVKSTGYQGLSAAAGNPKLFEQFVSQHQCNYYCGLLSLRTLKTVDSLQTPSKAKGSRSPLLHRKMASGSSSPQTGRKAAISPRLPRKSELEPNGGKAPGKPKAAETPKVV